MIAVTAFIFKAIIGSERTFAMPGLIFGKQERWYEYPVASGGNMHGGIFIKQISGNNDMVELIPFTLVFVCSRMIQDVGIGEKVIKFVRLRSCGDFFGSQYLCDTGIFRCIVEVTHDQDLRICANSQ